MKALLLIENNQYYITSSYGKPKLRKDKVYDTLSTEFIDKKTKIMRNIIGYADGNIELIELCEIIDANPIDVIDIIKHFIYLGIIKKCSLKSNTIIPAL